MQNLKNVLRTGKKRIVFWLLYWILLLGFIVSQKQLILQTQEEEVLSGAIIWKILLAFYVICFVIACWRGLLVKDYRERKQKRMGVWCYLFLFVNAWILFGILELVNNPDLREMEPQYMLLNAVGIMILSLILLFWLNSFRRTIIVMLAFFTVASMIFAYVYACRGEPLQFIDIFAIGTAMEVAGEYKFELTREMVVALVGAAGIFAVYLHFPDWQIAKRIWGKIGIRVAVIAGMVAGYYLYLNTSWNGDLGIMTDLWAPIKTYKQYGTEVGFFCVAKYMRLTEPEGYTEKKTEEMAEEITEQLKKEHLLSADVQKPVNLIAIMNESWADYRLLGDLQTTEPVMPFFDSMEENTIKGHTMVCIRGGGTAKTEYEFLTGNSEKRFPGMVPYVSYYTHDQHSIFETMKDQGYEIAAMHPNKGTNWSRNTAYRLMGVEDFYTIDDFPEDAKRVRAHISDEANYDAIIRLVEEKENREQPFFLFDVTMQNHGGYKAKKYQSTLQVEGISDPTVEQYMSLLRESDNALKKLIRYFEKCPEPTMIVMFGDHYPDLPETFTEHLTGKSYEDSSLEEQEKYYETPFFIWANYDLEEKAEIVTSTNYLGTMMLEEAGLRLPLYNRYLQQLQEKMPALNHLGYMDPEGEWHAWKDAEEEAEQLEWKYECFQYNNLAENRKRLDWFFKLGSDDAD